MQNITKNASPVAATCRTRMICAIIRKGGWPSSPFEKRILSFCEGVCFLMRAQLLFPFGCVQSTDRFFYGKAYRIAYRIFRPAFSFNQAEKLPGTFCRHFSDWSADAGEGRIGVSRQHAIVESNEGEIPGNIDSGFVRCSHGAKRYRIRCGNYCGRFLSAFQKSLHTSIAAFGAVIAG